MTINDSSSIVVWIFISTLFVAYKITFLIHAVGNNDNFVTIYSPHPRQKAEIHSIRMIWTKNMNHLNWVDCGFLTWFEEIKLLWNWHFAVENHFLIISQDIKLYIEIKAYIFGSSGTMTVSHTNNIPISWILVILSSKENFPYAVT